MTETSITETENTSNPSDVTLAIETCLPEHAEGFRRICLLLRECKEKGHYKHSADSWNEYVAGIGLTLTRANKMVRFAQVYSAIIQQTGANDHPPLGHANEDRLLNDWLPCIQYDRATGAVENAEDAIGLLAQAATLSYSDFQAVKDQHKQSTQHPDVGQELAEGPVLDDKNNIVGNYRTKKATGKQHYFIVGILDDYIRTLEGNEIKVSLGK